MGNTTSNNNDGEGSSVNQTNDHTWLWVTIIIIIIILIIILIAWWWYHDKKKSSGTKVKAKTG